MSKLTKKDLNERLLMVETLLGLHRVLPEQISNDQANNAIFRMQCALSRGKELAERKPQLKQLDRSIFDGLDEKWRFAAVDKCGECWTYTYRPAVVPVSGNWTGANKPVCFGEGYDASNWQNSLIERDIAKELLEVDLSSELTGSDLARAMLERGDKYVLCFVSDFSDDCAVNQSKMINLVTHKEGNSIFAKSARWKYAVPINQQTGEPLTKVEAGL